MQKSPSRLKLRKFQQPEFTRRQKVSKKAAMKTIAPNKQEPVANANTKTRLLTVWGILMAAGVGLAINVYNLQIVQGSRLTQRARNQQMVNLRPYMPRRLVVDRNDNVLAVDRPVHTLYAHPKLFKRTNEEIADRLAPIIDRNPADLVKIFQGQKSGITLTSSLPEELADRVRRLNLDGLEMIPKYSRYYPQDDLVADVVGYVDVDRRGQAGIERSQEKWLERSVKTVRLSRAGNGALMPDYAPEGFLNADDLRMQLTIDTRLQRVTRTALKEQLEKFGGKRGAVIVMDALDGSILALASQPTYNPNEYSKADISLFKNWTVADLYEPGSTFKPLNVAIALENGAIKADDVFNDSGAIRIGTHTIRNAQRNGYGRINIAQICKHPAILAWCK